MTCSGSLQVMGGNGRSREAAMKPRCSSSGPAPRTEAPSLAVSSRRIAEARGAALRPGATRPTRAQRGPDPARLGQPGVRRSAVVGLAESKCRSAKQPGTVPPPAPSVTERRSGPRGRGEPRCSAAAEPVSVPGSLPSSNARRAQGHGRRGGRVHWHPRQARAGVGLCRCRWLRACADW